MDRTADTTADEVDPQGGRTSTRARQSPVGSGPESDARPGRHRAGRARLHGPARVLVNVGLVVTLTAMLVANMPDSVVKSRLLVGVQPYLNALGLGQNWGMFAPNPRTQAVYVTGHLRYSDGTSSVWSAPARTGLMAYSDYRWRKFGEHLRLDRNRHLWHPFAAYVARHDAKRGREPVDVSLVRQWADLPSPGSTPDVGPWRRFVYYTTPVRPAG